MDSIHSDANSTVFTGTGTVIVNSTPWEFTMGTLTKQAIVNHPKYAHLFSGVGHFKCKCVHITMKQNGTPFQKPLRRVLITIKDKFKQELDSMEAQGIISTYDGHDVSPEWLNSFVIVKKPSGALHICLDPTDLNKEIIRPVCNAQTMDDVIHKLQHAKYFAVFDTSKGFYIKDNILVYSTTYDEFKSNVISFLDRCVQEDMHLNPDKVKIDAMRFHSLGTFCQKMALALIPIR